MKLKNLSDHWLKQLSITFEFEGRNRLYSALHEQTYATISDYMKSADFIDFMLSFHHTSIKKVRQLMADRKTNDEPVDSEYKRLRLVVLAKIMDARLFPRSLKPSNLILPFIDALIDHHNDCDAFDTNVKNIKAIAQLVLTKKAIRTSQPAYAIIKCMLEAYIPAQKDDWQRFLTLLSVSPEVLQADDCINTILQVACNKGIDAAYGVLLKCHEYAFSTKDESSFDDRVNMLDRMLRYAIRDDTVAPPRSGGLLDAIWAMDFALKSDPDFSSEEVPKPSQCGVFAGNSDSTASLSKSQTSESNASLRLSQ